MERLIDAQRRLSASKNPFERVVGSLCVAGVLKRRLGALTDKAVGQLMFDYVWPDMNVFGPETTSGDRAPSQFLLRFQNRKGECQSMKKAAIYVRVSTPDQHVESQLYDLRELAARRGFEVVHEYEDRGVCGKKARRLGLDALMADARRKNFSVVLGAAFDRIARSTRNFLQVIDELDSMGIEFISRRENVDTSGPMGRLFVTIISAIAELERSLVVDRVKSGMRRARLGGRQIGACTAFILGTEFAGSSSRPYIGKSKIHLW